MTRKPLLVLDVNKLTLNEQIALRADGFYVPNTLIMPPIFNQPSKLASEAETQRRANYEMSQRVEMLTLAPVAPWTADAR